MRKHASMPVYEQSLLTPRDHGADQLHSARQGRSGRYWTGKQLPTHIPDAGMEAPGLLADKIASDGRLCACLLRCCLLP
jgi:hypothetical protein